MLLRRLQNEQTASCILPEFADLDGGTLVACGGCEYTYYGPLYDGPEFENGEAVPELNVVGEEVTVCPGIRYYGCINTDQEADEDGYYNQLALRMMTQILKQ